MRIIEKTSSLSDQYLVEYYNKDKNKKYLIVLLKRYSHLIAGVCMKYCKDEVLAEKYTLHIYNFLSSELLNKSIDNFSSWLYVVIKDYCIRKLKDSKKDVRLESPSPNSLAPAVHNYSLEKQLKVIEECSKELNKEQANCLMFFYIKNKSYQEIANLSKSTLDRTRKNVQNSKRKLKNCINLAIEKNK